MTEVIVLCYHAISPSWEADLSVTPDEFERQIDHLLGRGWHPVTFADAVLSPSARRTLAITFDDAFASVKRYAAPVLAARGAPATVFAPTRFVSDRMKLAWPGTDQWLGTDAEDELTGMDWDELNALAALGWEIGSHTHSHPKLTQLDDAALEAELAGSRAEVARRLDGECRTIAYPYGDVDARVAAAARRSGYAAGAALSSHLRPLGPLRHPRVGIYRGDRAWRFRVKAAAPVRSLRASRLWPGMPG
jgi:peptidoglycan/xylan/chitin deacetylase (PgdA/CDA1 family)